MKSAAALPSPASVVFPVDQVPIPAEHGVRGDDGADSGPGLAAQLPGPRRRTPALGIGQSEAPAAKLFAEDPALLEEIFDPVLLLPVHPAGHREDQEQQGERVHTQESASVACRGRTSRLLALSWTPLRPFMFGGGGVMALCQSAVASLAEGLEEPLTLHRLGLYPLLGFSFKTTNCLEWPTPSSRSAAPRWMPGGTRVNGIAGSPPRSPTSKPGGEEFGDVNIFPGSWLRSPGL